MKKYLEISKINYKIQLAYRFDIAVNVLFTVAKILLPICFGRGSMPDTASSRA
jgi:sensor histidine kinase YesM